MSGPRPPLPDESARERARNDLDASFLVEAGAGTGKTSLIVERIANLIDGGVELRKIVAMTFSEKAAGELKLRLRQALETRSTNGSDRAAAALGELERASVSTIHAWCSSLLRSHPVEAGIDPLFSVLDQNAAGALFDSVWESWLGHELSAAGGENRVPIVDVPGVYPDWWLSQFRKLAEFLVRNRWTLDGDGGGPLPSNPDEDPAEALAERLRRVDLSEAAGRSRDAEDTLAVALRRAAEAVRAYLAADADGRRGLLFAKKPDLVSTARKLGQKGNWGGDVGVEEAREVLASVREAARDARAGLAHALCARIAGWIAAGFLPAYEAEKAEAGALDFDDLLVRTARLLRDHRSVRKQVRAGVRHLIVDEFQDTDAVQCEAAFLLTSAVETSDWTRAMPRPGGLFLVGDSKQSIYGFRGADIETYSTARGRLGDAGSLLSISTNFRSRRSVLAWVNAAFSELMAVPEEDRAPYRTDYAALDVFHEDASEGSGVHVLRAPAGAEFSTAAESRDAESRHVAALLRDRARGFWRVRDKRTGEERPAAWRDMVVLVRSRASSLPAYERAFRAAEIPYVVVGGRALWERQEVRAFAALCDAIENPYDSVSVVAALKSPFFGASDADLLLWKHAHRGFHPRAAEDGEPGSASDGVVGQALRRLRRWHRERLEKPPYRLLEEVLSETGALTAFGLKPDGAQRVANLMRLVEASRGHADEFGPSGAPPSFRGWVHWLDERVRETRDEAEGAVLEDDSDAVQILTMHASKGLEFPIVVLGDLGWADASRDSMHVDPEDGAFAFRLGNQEIGIETGNLAATREALKARHDAEALRLLYVAATRARDALVLPLFPSKKPTGFLALLANAFPALLEAEPGSAIPAGEGGPARVVDAELEPVSGDAPVFRVPLDDLESALAGLPRSVEDEGIPADPDAQVLADGIAARAVGRSVLSVTATLGDAGERDSPLPSGGRLPAGTSSRSGRSGSVEGRGAGDVQPSTPRPRLNTALPPTPSRREGGSTGAPSRREADSQPARALAPLAMEASGRGSGEPAFTPDEARRLGTAVHAALELTGLDDEQAAERAAISESDAAGLRPAVRDRAGLLARNAIRLPSLARARRSPRLLREWPFMIPGGDPPADWLLEGVVDVAWIEDGKLVVLDYKTDFVTSEEQVIAAAEHHLRQLHAYAWALSRATGLQVKSVIVALLALPVEVERPVTSVELKSAEEAAARAFATRRAGGLFSGISSRTSP